MRKKIKEQLRRIEDAENIKILLAVESGAALGDLHLQTVTMMCDLFISEA